MTRSERVKQKERLLLEAARAVFVEKGYDGARVTEIARRAGISDGALYSYYKAKSDLMQAVLAEFWAGLTDGALTAVASEADSFAQLRALARYHLAALIANFDFINLTFALRRTGEELAASREKMRRYAAVFDEVFRRGMDRGVIDPKANLRAVRDSFFGSLEYSARSIVQRSRRHPGDAEAAVDNVIGQIRACYGLPASGAAEPRTAPADAVMTRLEALAVSLERSANQLAGLASQAAGPGGCGDAIQSTIQKDSSGETT
ncbi:TetR/AcrR family transcriptional regulator [Marinibaculum pumilum]|uniref:TetR/AcrR family transcriptional regulator n=1 Tax=Marinibaculum pumilum TaxID=1766165 RepID=A0ABV7KUH2_9PROT